MQHFDITNWVDYVRGVTSATETGAMDRHLAEGCESCAYLAALVLRIRNEAAQDPVVPEHLVRQAKAVFTPSRVVSREFAWLPRLAPKLFFSAGAVLAEEGARSAAPVGGEVLCRAGDYTIELHVEREPDSGEMALVGQALKAGAARSPLGDAPVLLVSRRKVVAHTISNQFGEFCLVSGVKPGLKLCVQIEDIGRQVEIPLTSRILGSS
jgi:anti-sigma factor RsiW